MVSAAVLADLSDGNPYLVGDESTLGLLAEAQDSWEMDINRKIGPVTETIQLDGQETNRVIVPARCTPLLSIQSFMYPLAGELPQTGYVWDSTGVIKLTGVNTAGQPVSDARVGRFDIMPRFPRGTGNLTVSLTHGWNPIPPQMRGAVARWAAMRVLERDAGERDKGLQSKSLGDRSESFGAARHQGTISRLYAEYARARQLYRSAVG
jgi:hypothetical protein